MVLENWIELKCLSRFLSQQNAISLWEKSSVTLENELQWLLTCCELHRFTSNENYLKELICLGDWWHVTQVGHTVQKWTSPFLLNFQPHSKQVFVNKQLNTIWSESYFIETTIQSTREGFQAPESYFKHFLKLPILRWKSSKAYTTNSNGIYLQLISSPGLILELAVDSSHILGYLRQQNVDQRLKQRVSKNISQISEP